jgi:hypothetical protein
MEKDRRDLLPIFRWKESTEIVVSSVQISKELIVTGSNAINVNIFPIIDNYYSTPLYNTLNLVPPNYQHGIKLSLNINTKPNDFECQYVVSFTDEVGRPYVQHIGMAGDKPVILYPLVSIKDFKNKIINTRFIKS